MDRDRIATKTRCSMSVRLQLQGSHVLCVREMAGEKESGMEEGGERKRGRERRRSRSIEVFQALFPSFPNPPPTQHPNLSPPSTPSPRIQSIFTSHLISTNLTVIHSFVSLQSTLPTVPLSPLLTTGKALHD